MAPGRGGGGGGGDEREAGRARLANNPFYVLELRPDCSRAEVERAGQKLLAMLELELAAARRYRSPLGVHERSPEQVREAMAELRDPNRRLVHELWATLEPRPASEPEPEPGAEPTPDERAESDAGEDPAQTRFAALRLLGFGGWRPR